MKLPNVSQNWWMILDTQKLFIPRAGVTRYLNRLASRIYLDIYRNKESPVPGSSGSGKPIFRFVAYKHRRELFWAFIIFTTMAIMAAFSAAHDDSFVRGILERWLC